MRLRRAAAGLDIGRHTVKLAVAGRERVTFRHAERVPGRSCRNGSEPDLLEERLRELAEWLPEGRQVVAALQGDATVCGYLELPPMSEAELGVAVPSVVRREVPFPMEELSLSYQPVPRLSGDGTAVFYVAARRRQVREVQSLVERAGLELVRLEVPALALAREAASNHGLDGFTALVHAGFELTQVVVARGAHPYYVRDFPLAGGDFTYSIQMGLRSTWSDAEAFKRNLDTGSRQHTVEPFLSRWLDEVSRSLVDSSARSGARPERVLLSGGTARWTGLDIRLEERLGLPVSRDLWNGLSGDPETAASAKLAAGLALGGLA